MGMARVLRERISATHSDTSSLMGTWISANLNVTQKDCQKYLSSKNIL